MKLELFEGPLDLLLHLIKKNEVDIADIPISTITDQYLAYLVILKEMNLDVAGEFLVMAATLMYIKSRFLLPELDGGDDDEDEGDPRTELVERLREYQRFREVALGLGTREILHRDVFARPRDETVDRPERDGSPGEFRDVSLGALLDAFRAVLRRTAAAPAHEVMPEGLTIRDCVWPILVHLRSGGQVRFEALFAEGTTRHRVIVTFLALLELMRLGAVVARQDTEFEAIMIILGTATVEEAERLLRTLDAGDLLVTEEG